jgi:hypothetical protein
LPFAKSARRRVLRLRLAQKARGIFLPFRRPSQDPVENFFHWSFVIAPLHQIEWV